MYSKLIFKPGNRVIKTGKGIFPTSSIQASDQKTYYTKHFLFVKNWFSKQEMELSKQEMELSKQEIELFYLLPGLSLKNVFYWMSFNLLRIRKHKSFNSKQEIESCKKEMELFHLLPGILIKKLLLLIFSTNFVWNF